MDAPPRYRAEGDALCLDLRLRNPRQLFDSRDPAPFRERDLDPAALDYLLEALEELPADASLKVVLHFSEPPSPGDLSPSELAEAVKAHFAYELDQARRQRGRFLRQAQASAALALLVLVACLALAGWLHRRVAPGEFREAVREGLVILGWVALWRPLEAFLYDWWPYQRRIRRFRRLGEAGLDVRYGDATVPAPR